MQASSNAQTAASIRRFSRGDVAVLAASVVLLAALALVGDRGVQRAPPDFASMPVEQKKQAFFDYLSPIVTTVNAGLIADRDRVRALHQAHAQGQPLTWRDRRWLERLASRLEVALSDLPLAEALATLELRAGMVPESLVLVQAALESGWGTSRFAIEGNNYFGQRCYASGCGMEPQEQPAGASFGLARFTSVAHSVESYIFNLNTHPEYSEFRALRAGLRAAGQPVTGLALVAGLAAYSERGQEYVAEIAAMIRANSLE